MKICKNCKFWKKDYGFCEKLVAKLSTDVSVDLKNLEDVSPKEFRDSFRVFTVADFGCVSFENKEGK